MFIEHCYVQFEHIYMLVMAQEGSEASVASSSTASTNWHMNPFSPWHPISQWPQQNQNSSSCDDRDLSISNNESFTNVSHQSGITMDSSSGDLSGEQVDNHIWSLQVLLNVGSGGDMNHHHEDGENFLEALNSKNLTTDEMFGHTAYDYLKKMDNSWEFGNTSSLNNYNTSANNMIEPQRITNKLSDLVSNWSIAPPNPQLDQHIATSACNVSLSPSIPQYSASNIAHIKHEIPSYLPCYNHYNMKGERHHEHQDIGDLTPSLLGLLDTNVSGYSQIGFNDSGIGLESKISAGLVDNSNSCSINFRGCFSKQSAPEFRCAKPNIKASESSDSKKQGYESSSSRGRATSGSTEGKKKRSEDSSETHTKKAKNDNSTASSLKMQAPKAKTIEKITALQQLVSPFGKTDTASVLLETIKSIRMFHEQIQLLSDPYMKSSVNKDHNSWAELERKDHCEINVDLRSKGLCLVPVSCIPPEHRQNNGPDYWMPTYRSCLFRS